MMRAQDGEWRVLDNAEALALAAARYLTDLAVARGGLRVALAGGNTPRALYRALAAAPFRDEFPWGSSLFFLGDERFVGADDPASNARMVRETLIEHVPLRPRQFVAMQTEGVDAAASARAYAVTIHIGAPEGGPLFDVVLLGLGEDGHTASLLPGAPVLTERERSVAVVPEGCAQTRMTLTYPAIAASGLVVFLVSGGAKRRALAGVRAGDVALPAVRVVAPSVVWFVDRAAYG